MGATWGAGFCLTGPLHKAIGGRICRRTHKNMQRNVTSAKDLHQTSINSGESSTHWLALGLLLNGGWCPFPKAAGKKKFLLVGTDYFTKWVEVEPLANIRDVDAKKFIWKNIITQFRVPHTLISDNGLQFDSKAFRRYCCNLGITNRYSTPAYPQGNGQAEAVK